MKLLPESDEGQRGAEGEDIRGGLFSDHTAPASWFRVGHGCAIVSGLAPRTGRQVFDTPSTQQQTNEKQLLISFLLAVGSACVAVAVVAVVGIVAIVVV